MIQETPQTLCAGRYTLVVPLGEGGMATVWRGFDHRLRVWRAIKLLSEEYGKRPKLRARFDAEAQTMAALEHPNIVRVYDLGVETNIPYIVMELCESGTIVDWLDEHGAMPPRLAVEVMIQVCAGMSAAHAKGVIHRDIKPHNILVASDGICKVSDFGIARLTDNPDAMQDLTRTGSVMGTLGYMAPEQRNNAKMVDARADIYALGATLYTMLTNRTTLELFAAVQDDSLLEGVHRALFPIILRSTAYKREERYPSADALAAELREIEDKLPALPATSPPLVRPPVAAPTPPSMQRRVDPPPPPASPRTPSPPSATPVTRSRTPIPAQADRRGPGRLVPDTGPLPEPPTPSAMPYTETPRPVERAATPAPAPSSNSVVPAWASRRNAGAVVATPASAPPKVAAPENELNYPTWPTPAPPPTVQPNLPPPPPPRVPEASFPWQDKSTSPGRPPPPDVDAPTGLSGRREATRMTPASQRAAPVELYVPPAPPAADAAPEIQQDLEVAQFSAAAVFVHLDCRPKRSLAGGKALEGCFKLHKLLRLRQNMTRMAEEAKKAKVKVDNVFGVFHGPDGDFEATWAEMLQEVQPLERHADECAGCPARLTPEAYGCMIWVPWPVPLSAESWLISRLEPADRIGGMLAVETIQKHNYTGKAIATLRSRGRFESKEPLTKVVRKTWLSTQTLSTDQLFHALLIGAAGGHEPNLCLGLLLWFGGLMIDGVRPDELTVAHLDEALAMATPQERKDRTRLLLGTRSEDPGIRTMQQMLHVLFLCWVNGVKMLAEV